MNPNQELLRDALRRLDIAEQALSDARIVELTEGKNVVKKIYVPGRMVNLVVK